MSIFARVRSLAVVGITILVLALIQLSPLTLGTVHADATHQATIGMPFTGKWAYNVNVNPPYTDSNSSHPSVHAKYYGDWATDVYAPDGTAVKFEVPSATGSASYSFVSYADGNCGQRTVISVSVGGVTVGSVYYEHLGNAVKSGTVTNGMIIGYVQTQYYNGAVCNPGPHVHIELKNTTNYACYVDHGNPGVTLSEGVGLGVLGSTNTGERQACASSGSPFAYQSFMGDFNGDNVVDLGLRNPVTGMFYIRYGPDYSNQTAFGWDNSTNYQSFVGDYNGDHVADVGLRNPTTGTFYVRYGPDFGTQTTFTWDNSVSNYQAFVGDFNGDGIVDFGLRNPNTGTFYVRYGPNFTSQTTFQWDNSVSNYQAFMGDFNGDHIVDVGLRNPATGMFYVRYGPNFTSQTTFQWDNSVSNYQAFVGDFNGDGIVDVGLRNPSTGTLYTRYGPNYTTQTTYTWDHD